MSASEIIRWYSKLPLVPRDSFFRISDIGLINHNKKTMLTYGMFNQHCPNMYAKGFPLEMCVSPVIILSSYNGIFRTNHMQWASLEEIYKNNLASERGIFPLFVDTNTNWIKQLDDIFN